MQISLHLLSLLVLGLFGVQAKDLRGSVCDNPQLKQEIAAYQPIADKIFDTVLNGEWKGYTWKGLAEFVDKFGARPSGSETLENAIDYMVEELKAHDIENVHTEPAMVEYWKRGKESCELVSPRRQPMNVLAVGGSISTPPGGIEAPVLVVASFEEMHERKDEVPGKIVVFNEEWTGYSGTVKYRNDAAEEVAALGGVASLARSVTLFSVQTPHTGYSDYYSDVKIPTGCITIEDAAMLHRMALRGEELVIHLVLESTDYGMVESRNTIGEIKGKEKPDSVVVVSGHLDSWDVGVGAMDDGGGVYISWNALAVLKKLGLRPRRTLRSILWTGEEQGLLGGLAYYESNKDRLADFDLVMESDAGTFDPQGLALTGSEEAACVVKEVLKLMKPVNATGFHEPADGPDILYFTNAGVPGVSLLNKYDEYFWYHHSSGDTMEVEDPDSLDRCLALWATAAYVFADMENDIPR